MSVYKSRRKDAAAQFIVEVRKLRRDTMRIVSRFPTSYRWIVTNNLLELATQAYTDSVRGNAVYVHKDMSRQDFELRHRYLMMAATAVDALLSEITFCYELVEEGNNFFSGKADYDAVFEKWTAQGREAKRRLDALIESDKNKFKNYQKKREEASAKKQQQTKTQ